MPHGAFEVLIARRLLLVTGLTAWAMFLLGYLGLSAAVVAVWFVAPTLFLSTFLIDSALHFASDFANGVNGISRGVYGGAVIVLPALWHGEELQRLLGRVAGPDSAALVAPVLAQPAWLHRR